MNSMGKPLKIHVLIDNITTGGGIERVASVLFPMLAEDHQVKILGLLDKDQQSIYSFPDSVTIKPLYRGDGQGDYIKSLGSAFEIIANDRPDIVLSLSMGRLSVFAAPFIAKAKLVSSGTRYIACEHIGFNSHAKPIRLLKKLTFPLYDRVIFLTRRDLDNFKNKSKLDVILNPSPFAIVQEYRRGVENKLVIAIGHLIHRKGFDLLITAWAKFVKAHPDWRLLIIGEGPEHKNLQALIKRLDVTHSCQLYGPCRNISELYEQADMMAMSSRSEGLPMTLIEAQSFGLPIVAFDCETGPREIVSQGKSGFLVEPFDTDAFAASMGKVIESQEVYTALSKGACDDAQRFSKESIKAEWQKMFGSTALAEHNIRK